MKFKLCLSNIIYVITDFSIAGVSRSSTICAAYLMATTNLEWQEAILAVRVARKVVDPNHGFQKQLQAFQLVEAKNVRILLRPGQSNFDI